MSSELVKTRITDAIPDEVFGFKVQITLGPALSETSGLQLPGQHAIFAVLRPSTEALRQKLQRVTGKPEILSQLKLTPLGAQEVQADEEKREGYAAMVLTPAMREAKRVHDAA